MTHPTDRAPQIVRRLVIVNNATHGHSEQEAEQEDEAARNESVRARLSLGAEKHVLVINSSSDMAKEIALQMSIAIPGCSLLFAPTLALARMILLRRSVDLVVSSAILPDGSIIRLKDTLAKLPHAPDVVVVGDLSSKNFELLSQCGYECTALHRLGRAGKTQAAAASRPELKAAIKALGADLRNDLNNPLQEIVAMVFVAQASGSASDATSQALEAIDNAAKNLAEVVQGLEEKISKTVNGKS